MVQEVDEHVQLLTTKETELTEAIERHIAGVSQARPTTLPATIHPEVAKEFLP